MVPWLRSGAVSPLQQVSVECKSCSFRVLWFGSNMYLTVLLHPNCKTVTRETSSMKLPEKTATIIRTHGSTTTKKFTPEGMKRIFILASTTTLMSKLASGSWALTCEKLQDSTSSIKEKRPCNLPTVTWLDATNSDGNCSFFFVHHSFSVFLCTFESSQSPCIIPFSSCWSQIPQKANTWPTTAHLLIKLSSLQSYGRKQSQNYWTWKASE